MEGVRFLVGTHPNPPDPLDPPLHGTFNIGKSEIRLRDRLVHFLPVVRPTHSNPLDLAPHGIHKIKAD